MIVVDIGCAEYGGDVSIPHLIAEFHPRVIYGFDPAPSVITTAIIEDGTRVLLERKAAWLYDGEIGYVSAGLSSWLTEERSKPRVPCFDLDRFIRDLATIESLPGEEIVLKLDCEGSEFDLLERLIETGTDKLLTLVWVEWHIQDWYPDVMIMERLARQAAILARISCSVTEWNH